MHNQGNWASLVAQLVKNLLGMQETRVWFLGQDDPVEKEMATHSSILAWRIPWMEEPGRWAHGVKRVGPDWATKPTADNRGNWILNNIASNILSKAKTST